MYSLNFTCFIFLSRTPPTRTPLLCDRSIGGLYPFSFHGINQLPAALLAARPTLDLWYQRLGHLGIYTLRQVLSHNSLLVSPMNKHASVCNACQMAKSFQLPFCDSINTTFTPLELIHTDVWGPAIQSSSVSRYCVSFIDDYTRFTWIYTLHYKCDVHCTFLEFQRHVEHLLDICILCVQSDWGGWGEYQRLNTFLKSACIYHCVSCPHTHQKNGVGA
jgi:hypothetical protein